MIQKVSEEQKTESIIALRRTVTPGSTIWILTRYMSKAGRIRVITPYIIAENKPHDVGFLVASAFGREVDQKLHGIKLEDVSVKKFIAELAAILYPDGFHCSGDIDCRAIDHAIDHYIDYKAHYSTDRLHKYGGDALRLDWL